MTLLKEEPRAAAPAEVAEGIDTTKPAPRPAPHPRQGLRRRRPHRQPRELEATPTHGPTPTRKRRGSSCKRSSRHPPAKSPPCAPAPTTAGSTTSSACPSAQRGGTG